jgi:hypothetical protein
MEKPLIIKNKDNVIISYNGRKLIEPIDKYKNMSDKEILNNFIKIRNIKHNNRR